MPTKRPAPRGFIQDWATEAARYINPRDSVERIAAIIATHAEPLLTALDAARRSHDHCEDEWYCCGKCDCECEYRGDDNHEHHKDCYPYSHKGEAARVQGVCNCGADAVNAKIDAALAGR